MTEESFQQCKKVMKKANTLRRLITVSKKQVAELFEIEQLYLEKEKYLQAEATRKNIDKVLKVLNDRKKRFEELVFPDSNIVVIKTVNIENI